MKASAPRVKLTYDGFVREVRSVGYWVVDPALDSIHVYRRAGYTHIAELTLEHRDVLRTPLMPGLDLPLTAIFEG